MFAKLKRLIEKRYYADRETAISKVDEVFLMNKITQAQFEDLNILIDEYYPEMPEPNEVEETPQEEV